MIESSRFKPLGPSAPVRFGAVVLASVPGTDYLSASYSAFHVLNDDFNATDKYCLNKRDCEHKPDRTCYLLLAIVHRRQKLYLEAEGEFLLQ